MVVLVGHAVLDQGEEGLKGRDCGNVRLLGFFFLMDGAIPPWLIVVASDESVLGVLDGLRLAGGLV